MFSSPARPVGPTVYGRRDHGFIPALIGIAQRTGVSAYVGDGTNRWSAVHRAEAARLYRLVIEQEDPVPVYRAIDEERLVLRAIAEAFGRVWAHLSIRAVSIILAGGAVRGRRHAGVERWRAHDAGMGTG